MPEFSVETGVIHYDLLDVAETSRGDMPTLLLLHNFMSTGRGAWGPLLDDLSKRYRIILPDLPGHGRSVGHPIGFNHAVIARQVAALVGALDATDAHVAGCSSGGMIAQLLVHHGLMQPASLTLVSTTHSVEPAANGSSAALIPERFQASEGWLQATARLHDPYRYDGYYEDVLLPGFRSLRGYAAIDLPLEALTHWPMPACIIHGALDEFFPVRIAERMAEALPDCRLYVIPRQSHALIFRQPWTVLARMLAFYDRRTVGEKANIP